MNNKSKLELLFDLILDKSYKLRKNDPINFDGYNFWQPIKSILTPLDKYNAKKWKKTSEDKIKKIMSLPEYIIDGYENKIINENYHFIIQQVRIPLKEIATIKKIIQIALNIGQYKGTNKGKFIYNIKFDTIHEFIYKKDIIYLSQYLTEDIMIEINNYLNNL